MNSQQLWKQFCDASGIDVRTDHETWAFGGNPAYLADLVLKGIKTATASGYDMYFLDEAPEPLPKAGDYSVILNEKDEAVCVIRTVKTSVVPFDEVTEDHAFKEGEGDRTLAYWRRIHEEFFTEDFASYGLKFHPKSRILCEEFVVCCKASEEHA